VAVAGCGAAGDAAGRAAVRAAAPPAASRSPGGGDGGAGAVRAGTADAGPAGPTVSVSGGPARGAPVTRAAGGGAATAAAGPTPSALPSSAPLTVRVVRACVVPGGEQRVELATLPGAFVAFDNLYPDGNDGRVHGGAEGQGRADGSGRYVAVWRVAPGTPPGQVRLDVAVAAHGRSAIAMRYWRLAPAC
jgi:hypothetical protein